MFNTGFKIIVVILQRSCTIVHFGFFFLRSRFWCLHNWALSSLTFEVIVLRYPRSLSVFISYVKTLNGSGVDPKEEKKTSIIKCWPCLKSSYETDKQEFYLRNELFWLPFSGWDRKKSCETYHFTDRFIFREQIHAWSFIIFSFHRVVGFFFNLSFEPFILRHYIQMEDVTWKFNIQTL